MARTKQVLTKKEIELKKEARNARVRAYREEHKEEINAKRRVKYAEKKKALESEDKKIEDRKAKQKENYKRWYAAHKEEINAKRRETLKKNKELLEKANITAGVIEEKHKVNPNTKGLKVGDLDLTEKEIMDMREFIDTRKPELEDKSFYLDTTYIHFDLLSRTVSPEVFKQIVIGLKHLEEANKLMKAERPKDAEEFSISCPMLNYVIKKD